MSKLGRLIRRRRENKRLSTVYQENGEAAPVTRKNSKAAEGLQQLLQDIQCGVDQHPRGAIPAQALGPARAEEATTIAG